MCIEPGKSWFPILNVPTGEGFERAMKQDEVANSFELRRVILETYAEDHHGFAGWHPLGTPIEARRGGKPHRIPGIPARRNDHGNGVGD